MTLTGRVTDKLIFAAIYLAAAVLLVWAAGRITDYALDVRFYRSYLMPWEVRLMALRYKTINWPAYNERDPMQYMQTLTQLMKANGIEPPASNTDRGYTYRLQKFGNTSHQVLLVYQGRRLVIYGLPKKTFNRLDRFIDGITDPGGGDFTGRWSTDRHTRIGYWSI